MRGCRYPLLGIGPPLSPELTYPRDIDPDCLAYELPWYARLAVDVYSYIERGLVTVHDLDAWSLRASEVAGAEIARIQRERRK